MAPLTRNQRRRSGMNAEAPAIGPAANGANGIAKKKPNGHIKFDSDDEDGTIAVRESVSNSPELEEKEEPGPKEEEEEEGEEEGDDDAPEVVTAASGREAVRKRQEEARQAIEAQEEATRRKRKRREAVLKEQKEQADARKRRKTAKGETIEPEDASAEEEKDTTSPDEGINLSTKNQVATVSSKAPVLLPESLLEKISSQPSPPHARKRAQDCDSDDESEDKMDKDAIPSEATLKKRERNRRKRLARNAKKEFKKGPVNVRVLKNDEKAKKIIMPPADRKAVSMRNAWLNGRGRVKRKSIGGGLGSVVGKRS